MNGLLESKIQCPYCGEFITILVDTSEFYQEYIEDCQVCCRPILFKINCEEDSDPHVIALSENE